MFTLIRIIIKYINYFKIFLSTGLTLAHTYVHSDFINLILTLFKDLTSNIYDLYQTSTNYLFKILNILLSIIYTIKNIESLSIAYERIEVEQ